MACLLIVSGLGCAAQDQTTDQDEPLPDEIRKIVVRVEDDHGNAISGLGPDTFTVWDNGRRRPIQSVRENNHAQTLTIVVLDQLDMAAGEISRSAEPLEKMLRSGLGESLCIYLINPEGKLIPIRSVTEYMRGIATDTSTADRLLKERNRTYPVQADLVHDGARRFNTAVIALHGLLEELEDVQQPRNILLVTEGFWIKNYEEECRKLAGDINQVNAPLYVLYQNAFLAADAWGFTFLSKHWRDEITSLTGGDVLIRADMAKAIARLQSDLRTSYTIEYVEREEERQDDYHTVIVDCKRAKVHLRYQQIYLASRP